MDVGCLVSIVFPVEPVHCVKTGVSSLLANCMGSSLFFQSHSFSLSTQSGTKCGSGGGLSLLVISSGGHLDLLWMEPIGYQVGNAFPVGPVHYLELEAILLLS